MKTILVWYLVTYGTNGVLSWSPPMVSIQECERVRLEAFTGYGNKGRCIQINEAIK